MSLDTESDDAQIRALRYALRQAERRLADTQQHVHTGSWELDIATYSFWWSDESYRLFGFEPGSIAPSYEAFLALVHPDDRAAIDRAYTDSVANHTPYEFVHRLILPDGRMRYIREVGRTTYDGQGQPIFSSGSSQDVTESVAAEQKLRAAEQRFRALIEHSTDVVAIIDRERRIAFLNETFDRCLGHAGSAWLGRDLLGLMWPDDAPSMRELFARALAAAEGAGLWQLRFQHASASPCWLEGTFSNRLDDPAIGGIILNARDISSRMQALESMRQSEERLRQALAVGQFGIFDHDHRGGTIYWSPRQREIYGYGPDDPVTIAGFIGYVHPDDRAWLAASIERAHDPAGDGTWAVEHRIVRPDGATRTLLSRSQTSFEGEGSARRPLRTVGAAIDVTELRAADEMMRIKDHAIASSINAIAITDAAGKIFYVNPAFMRAWGFESEQEVFGLTPLDLAEPVSTAQVLQQIAQAGSYLGELVVQRKDGSRFDILLSAHAMYDQQGRMSFMMGSFLDISAAKRMEAQLLQAQKMETIGRLAGGIAHDFNNLITVMKGNADLALSDLAAGDPLHGSLARIIAAADSAARLTQQLLAFSRKQIIDPQVLDLNDVIRRVQRMLGRLLSENIDLQVFLDADAGNVHFDRGQCEQILLNLAVNARDAMPNGGKLTIETCRVFLDGAYARAHHGAQTGAYVLLAVSDTGVGMAPDVKEHLFEPFFTTKGLGQGTGLGLAMVFGAIAQNGGRIEVYSEEGYGTTFKIYLPRVDLAAEPSDERAQPIDTRGDESILLVEDDDAVRHFAVGVLTREGYHVHAFSTGTAALQALGALGEAVDLLLTDVVMADMNGRELAERVQQRQPGLPVLFVSGYTDNVIVQHGVLKPGVEFLAKPYSVNALARRVRKLLDAPQP